MNIQKHLMILRFFSFIRRTRQKNFKELFASYLIYLFFVFKMTHLKWENANIFELELLVILIEFNWKE